MRKRESGWAIYKWYPGMLALILICQPSTGMGSLAQTVSVALTAKVTESPAAIELQWPLDTTATGYVVYRKNPGMTSWNEGITLPSQAIVYRDAAVVAGQVYEYQVKKTTQQGRLAFGFIDSGIKIPVVENRGKVLLVLEKTYSGDLALELNRLENDLIGDGWQVERIEVWKTDPVPQVKARIKAVYDSNPGALKSVFLFGNVPVPYSGDIFPDDHPNHKGAWPSDLYYAEMNGVWTDSSVTTTNAERSVNWNLPGDGKFDQNSPPSEVDLELGRVDLSNMTCFANKVPPRSEKDLLRQYLNKNHNWRHGQLVVPRRGLICDNVGEEVAVSGWRNFPTFFGSSNIFEVGRSNFFPTLQNQSFLWSYAAGGGYYYMSSGIGWADDFALQDIQVVFTMFIGSYFGDWNNESNFLRASLGSRSFVLAAAYAGYPHYLFHPMAMGKTLGHCLRLTQNNRPELYPPYNQGSGQAHISLLGDPTLRMHPVSPPQSVSGTLNPTGLVVSWSPSTDPEVAGYYVYRCSERRGPFTRISGPSPLTGNSFTDPAGSSNQFYMVRAIKLESSASGTYYNASQGLTFSLGSTATTSGTPAMPQDFTLLVKNTNHIDLLWVDAAGNELGFKIERREQAEMDFRQIAVLDRDAISFSDRNLSAGRTYYYRILSFNETGNSFYTVERAGTTWAESGDEPSAVFLRLDQTTQGRWINMYGADGYSIPWLSQQQPSYGQFGVTETVAYLWNGLNTEPRALQKIGINNNLASTWTSPNIIRGEIHFNDSQPHSVALYFLDWDSIGRVQTIRLLDAQSNRLLDTQTVSNFSQGKYLVWAIKRNVRIEIIRDGPISAVLSGIFLSPDLRAGPPQFVPGSGTYYGELLVSLSSSTPNATIRYTVDGSAPTPSSILYTEPFQVWTSATIRARAYHSDRMDSEVTTAAYTVHALNVVIPQAFHVQTDLFTRGSWVGRYGAEGFHVIQSTMAYPAFTSVRSFGQNSFTWVDPTFDDRALLKNRSTTQRIAACWNSTTNFTVELGFSDGKYHRLSIYFVDWDSTIRSQNVEIVDAFTGGLLDSRRVSKFNYGIYVTWDIRGRVRIRVSRLAGANAVMSGLFFDSSPVELNNPPLDLQSRQGMASPFFSLMVNGNPGQQFVIEASTNLIQWEPILTNILTGSSFEFLDPTSRMPRGFYRTRSIP